MDDLTTRRTRVVEERHGKETLKLAIHAAFPLTITSDLLYCLRENFLPDCPWYAVANVLASGLCTTIGYDLYEMEEETRNGLLEKLTDEFGTERTQNLANFMAQYILNRFKQEDNNYRREWIPLSYLMANEKRVEEIKQELRKLLENLPENDTQRVKWKELEEKYIDLEVFKPLLVKRSPDTVDKGSNLDDEEEQIAAATGITLKPFDFDVAVISPSFEFETITVNARGKVINTEQHQASYYIEYLGETPGEPAELNIEMVGIPGGSFEMGSPENERKRRTTESPQHTVTVKPFFMSKYPVTQEQWRFVARLPQVNRELKPQPSRFKGDKHPVECVSWYDAVEFCDRLSNYTGRPYTLPSEAQWEYACRAGTTTPFYFGDTITSELANYDASETFADEPKGEYRRETTPVGQSPPNVFGLYDMHGNVDEWSLDEYHNNYEGAPTDGSPWMIDNDNRSQNRKNAVLRGGSWVNYPEDCRSASRDDYVRADRDYDNNNVGFRVVCGVGRTLK